MERVVTINLNGNPFQLDESAYDALRDYLTRAEAALAANPDKAEIIRDLEQAIADKCAAFLSAHKSVVSAAEIAQVIAQMGPVEGEARAESASDAGADFAGTPKRLYRIRDRSSVTGVSAGLAAYFEVDVNWVRLGWVVAIMITGGFAFIPYLALMFIMPMATTPEQVAAAHGAPFNAEEIIERAKREYARFAEDGVRTWRSERRRWRSRERERWSAPAAPPAGYATRISAGLAAFVLSILSAALLIGFLIALVSLLNTGAVLGWTLDESVPTWLAIIVLCIIYSALSSPISAILGSSYATASGRIYRHQNCGGGGGMSLIFIGLAIWLAYLYIPEARVWIEHARDVLLGVVQSLRADF